VDEIKRNGTHHRFSSSFVCPVNTSPPRIEVGNNEIRVTHASYLSLVDIPDTYALFFVKRLSRL
jgi:hypothetical protein